MAYPASVIAFAFVNKAIEEGNPITQMKLQKILYFAQGVHLALNDKDHPLIKETFQAWKYGPVIPEIYREYKFYGSAPITDTTLITLFHGDIYEKMVEELDEKAKKTIEITWQNTKEIDGLKLSNWTHSVDSPWHKHYKEGVTDLPIPNEDIYDYFSKFMEKSA